ncbi:MAG: NAD(P)-dependent oxidoreductase [Brumimicrobium sp.]
MLTKLGLIKEGKTPPDKRVPLTPKQCIRVMEEFPDLQIVVQKSPIRAFKDEEYASLGIKLENSLEDCDIIMGVKEVNIDDLIPNKHFFFFSHTLKRQPYNRKLLKAIIDKKIQLTDYEALTKENGLRLVGFGRYAGIVGCFNAFRTYGLKHGLYNLKPAHECADRIEMEGELSKVKLPKNAKIVLTGYGRVGNGAREIIDLLPITEVSPEEFLNEKFETPVFAHLNVEDYNAKPDGSSFDKPEFYKSGKGFVSTFPRYLTETDMYIACHFWKEGAPFLYTREDLKSDKIRTSVVADISCDIDGPVASTIRASTIEDPIYGYDPFAEKEVGFKEENAIAVMAVDNLPCELPKDASQDFGSELIKYIFPALLGDDPTDIIARGTETTKEGKLSKHFEYLSDYLAGKE